MTASLCVDPSCTGSSWWQPLCSEFLRVPAAFAATTPAASAPAATYTMTSLGNLGYPTTIGAAINAGGQITGVGYEPVIVLQSPCPKHHTCTIAPERAFLWSAGKMTNLGTLSSTNTAYSQGSAINDSAEVVGTTSTATGVQAFVDQNGVMTAIGPGSAFGVNNSGLVVGSTTSSSGNTVAFEYSNGKTTFLGLLPGEGGIFTVAEAVNSSGEITGSGDNAASDERAWIYSNGKMTDIGTLGGPQASAEAINSSRTVVGFAQTASDADHGFAYSAGKMTDLGLNVFPPGINDSGTIVGETEGSTSSFAFVGVAGKLQNLNSLVPAGSGFTLTDAIAINRSGQVVVEGSNNTTGQESAFLLTPS